MRKVAFDVTTQRAVPVLLQILYTDSSVRTICPEEHEVRPHESKIDPTVTIGEEFTKEKEMSDKDAEIANITILALLEDPKENHVISVARTTTLKPWSETLALASTVVCGIVQLCLVKVPEKNYTFMATHGNIAVFPCCAFKIVESSLSTFYVTL